MGISFAFWTICALALGFVAGRASMRDEMRGVVYKAARDIAAARGLARAEK